VSCFAHVINLVVQDYLKELRSGTMDEAHKMCDRNSIQIVTATSVQKVRALAIFITRSPQRVNYWNVLCNLEKLSCKRIPYDVCTRWNSTFNMIDTAIELKMVYNRFVSTTSNVIAVTLEEKDWIYLTQLSSILKIFSDYTFKASLSSPQICTSLYDYMELDEIIRDICDRKEEFNGINEVFSSAGNSALRKFSKYYNLMDGKDIYYICASVDPFAKNLVYERQYESGVGKDITKTIIEHCEEAYPASEITSSPPKRKGD